MKFSLRLSLLALILVVAVPAAAVWRTHGPANVRLEYPPTWRSRVEGNQLMIGHPDGGIAIIVQAVAGGDDARNAGLVVRETLRRTLQNARVEGAEREIAQHGMRGSAVHGTGRYRNGPVEWMAFYLRRPNAPNGVVALGFARPEQRRQHWPTIQRILGSIQPAS